MIHFSPQKCEFLLPSLGTGNQLLWWYFEHATKKRRQHHAKAFYNQTCTFLSHVDLNHHVRVKTSHATSHMHNAHHEPAVHNHTCTVRDEVFLTEDSLNEHVKTNHETPPKQLVIEIPSEPLNEEIFNQYVITDHEASCTTNQIGPSGKATPDVNTQQSNPTCPICAKTFLVDKDLKQHVTSSHSVDTHQCDVCDYTMAHIEKEHLKTFKVPISNLSVLCCLQCTFTAIDQPDMKVHIETPHKIFIGPHYLPENIDSSIYGRPDPSPQLKLKYDENLLPICKVKPETSGSECLSGSGSKDEKKTINANIPKDV